MLYEQIMINTMA